MKNPIELPHTAECFVCGESNPHGLNIRFWHDDGKIIARCTPPPEKCGYRTIVHGGILTTLLDETMGWAPAFAKRRMCVAAELNIRFVKPVPVHTALVVIGRFVEDKRLFYRCEGHIEDEAHTVYVRGRGTFVPVSVEESIRIEAETLLYPEGLPKLFDQRSDEEGGSVGDP